MENVINKDLKKKKIIKVGWGGGGSKDATG